MAKQIKKSHNHDHFWIEDNIVYESCRTIRGMRYNPIAEVVFPDKVKLMETDIEEVNKILSIN